MNKNTDSWGWSMGWSMDWVHGPGPWGGPWTPGHVLYKSNLKSDHVGSFGTEDIGLGGSFQSWIL